ncbi:hypothetical protein Tsubulata_008962 [Turnera subulata]|uniref:Uncharacterized protein n=1 Tax=Turnera subulata TaxID=218843 RepID=A0A9Q0FTD5_9ROSI|nr:hypothetical protein Tsubulata_008962 [Turnera subulata]
MTAVQQEGVEAVLAKAIELRIKVNNCIHKATSANNSPSFRNNSNVSKLKEGFEDGGAIANGEKKKENPDGELLTEAEEDEEAERLLHIRDALESLEHQLSNLQALQQQQRYEKEVALSEIEHSRKVLLDKLKEYKGDDLEVIQEASAFVGETVEHNTDLLLPPYPIRPPHSVVDNQYMPLLHAARKSVRNGAVSIEAMKKLNDSEDNQAQTTPKTPNKRLGHIIGTAAKTVVTLVGVISVLSMSGVGGKRRIPFNILGLFQQSSAEDKERVVLCPPGRVLVLENGEARCIVKERVAIPFESAVARPDVNYGSG